MIKRYEVSYRVPLDNYESEDGIFILYSDHVKELAYVESSSTDESSRHEQTRAELEAAKRVAAACEAHLEQHRQEDPHLVSELRHELWQRDSECKALSQDRHQLRADLAAAQARVAELERRIDSEFTHDQLLAEVSSYRSGMMAAESALASARDLLERATEAPTLDQWWIDRDAWLSATPTPAPVASPCSECEQLRKRVAELEKLRLEQLWDWRGIEKPCDRCGGAGVRAYGSTATWHGGVGGQMITSAVCDKCWGSGDEVAWVSHREVSVLRAKLTQTEETLVLQQKKLEQVEAELIEADAWLLPGAVKDYIRRALGALRAD